MNMTQIFRALVALSFVFTTGTAAFAGDLPANQAQPETATPQPGSTNLYTRYTPFQLLDLSKLSFRHSYSMSYVSSGGYSANRGVYTTSIGYRISDPLYVQLDLGLVHQPGALFGGDSRQLDAQVRPNFFLRYAPSRKFSLIVDVRTMPFYQTGFGYGRWPH